jgi:AraC family transcriptional regulator
MNTEATRRDYIARVNQIVDLIQKHPGADLSLETLAEEAGFSAFHFHRVFAGVTGEPLHAFVRRTRLERAAMDLERIPQRSITDIALDYGFSSSANFSRAFKEAFGAGAREFRTARTHYPEQAREILKRIQDGRRHGTEQLQQQLVLAAQEAGRTPPKVSIEMLPTMRLAYVRHYGPYEEEQKAALFQRIRHWADRALAGKPVQFVGICYGERGLLAPDKRRYDAGVLLPEGVLVEAPVAELTIPGGKVGLLRRRSENLLVCAAWAAMHRDWLPGSGYTPDDRPCVERFPEGCPVTGTPFTLEVCQAIRPLGATRE